MKRLAQNILRYLTLTAITVVALVVMWWASAQNDETALRRQQQMAAPVPMVARPRPVVAVQPLTPELCELTSTFTGKVQPWETYTLGFDVAGRVSGLGENQRGQPLDEGDEVTAGQLLARLDDRIFAARKSEAAAQLEEATTELRRARDLRQRNVAAISETEFQGYLTELARARAEHEIALKNLEDAVLSSPVDATISRRMVNVGETVGANEVAFELVQNDEVLLVVDVPESQIRELEMRMRRVRAQRESESSNPLDQVFRAYVDLEGRDRFGRPWPTLEAEVHHIAEVADARTGLFEVEIRVPNQDRLLRGGMVAAARIVTDHLRAYRIPENAVIFRGRDAAIFTLDSRAAPLQVMFWEVASTLLHQARRVPLEHWIEQGPHVIVPADEDELSSVVVRGQQRLADGQLVRVVGEAPDTLRQVEGHEPLAPRTSHLVPATR